MVQNYFHYWCKSRLISTPNQALKCQIVGIFFILGLSMPVIWLIIKVLTILSEKCQKNKMAQNEVKAFHRFFTKVCIVDAR